MVTGRVCVCVVGPMRFKEIVVVGGRVGEFGPLMEISTVGICLVHLFVCFSLTSGRSAIFYHSFCW